ncbi:MAG: CPBP family intramembrane metalloprotease, partial [Candidatus Sumerlaeia bacterium]|nr:CPBP family intramembrane metalloprotease [Candidatus Sumerlaeia bacterium]
VGVAGVSMDELLKLYRALAPLGYLAVAGALGLAGLAVLLRDFGGTRRRVGGWHVVAALVCGVGLVGALAAAVVLGLLGFAEWLLLSAVVGQAALAVCAGMALPLGLLLDERLREGRSAPGKGEAAWGTALGTAVVLTVSFGGLVLVGQWVEIRHSDMMERMVSTWGGLGVFAVVAVVAALVEEVVFRLGLQGVLEAFGRRIGLPAGMAAAGAIVGASVLFALGHAGMVEPDGLKELQIFFVGVVLGTLKWRYGLWSCVVAHLVLNLAALGVEVAMRLAPETISLSML